ncbi:hypothetical protein C1879_10690 [Paraeggerthella hongkongensis]|uniref:hypothetical protein n=1 Tax=Paraeggerthella sp. TaxID=2897350 RepID=UPI000DF7DFC1|nr:hypothetical protein C1879_10690 [Paraeggerthella hongkongensis]
MREYCQHINMRLTPDEKSRAISLAKSKDLSVSQLMRILIKLPAESADADGVHTAVIIDRSSVPKLEREMRRWGHHYNQAVHALNRIAYYVERGSLKTEETHQLLRRAEGNLEDLNVAVAELRDDVKGIAQHTVISL